MAKLVILDQLLVEALKHSAVVRTTAGAEYGDVTVDVFCYDNFDQLRQFNGRPVRVTIETLDEIPAPECASVAAEWMRVQKEKKSAD